MPKDLLKKWRRLWNITLLDSMWSGCLYRIWVGAQSTPYLESRLGGKGGMDTSRQKANKAWKRAERGSNWVVEEAATWRRLKGRCGSWRGRNNENRRREGAAARKEGTIKESSFLDSGLIEERRKHLWSNSSVDVWIQGNHKKHERSGSSIEVKRNSLFGVIIGVVRA